MNFRGTFFPDMSCRNVAPWQMDNCQQGCAYLATRRDWLMALQRVGSLLQTICKNK
jgi:hypothetical protein